MQEIFSLKSEIFYIKPKCFILNQLTLKKLFRILAKCLTKSRLFSEIFSLMTEKKQYSTAKYLDPKKFEEFKELIDSLGVTEQELADFAEVKKRTIQYRMAKKRLTRVFARDFVKSKKDELEEKFKNVEF